MTLTLEELKEKLEGIDKEMEKFGFLQELGERVKKLQKKLEREELYVVFVGEFSSGKTSLINQLFGLNLPVDVLPETSAIWKVAWGDQSKGIMVHLKNGEIRRVASPEEVKQFPKEEVAFVETYVQSELNKGITVVDTPGLSSLDEFHQEILTNFINESDVLLVAVSVGQGLTKTTKEFLEKELKGKRDTYIVLTMADTKPPQALKEIEEYLKEEFSDFIEGVAVTSAKKGMFSDLEYLLKQIAFNKRKILVRRITEEIKFLCKMASGIVEFQMENADLDLKELDERERKVTMELDKVENRIKREQEAIRNRVDDIIKGANSIIIEELLSNLDYIMEAVYDSDLEEGLNDRLAKVGKEAVEKAENFVKREIGSIGRDLDDLSIGLDSRKFEVKALSLRIAEILIKIREEVLEVLEVVSDSINRVAGFLVRVLRNLVTKLVKGVTKGFVKRKLEESIKCEIIPEIESQIGKVRPLLEEIFKSTLSDLEMLRNSLLKAVSEIREEKKKRAEEFQKYLDSLKEAKSRFNECWGMS